MHTILLTGAVNTPFMRTTEGGALNQDKHGLLVHWPYSKMIQKIGSILNLANRVPSCARRNGSIYGTVSYCGRLCSHVHKKIVLWFDWSVRLTASI